jgi:hypothetical protein
MTIRILAIDPGKTTGICVIDGTEDDFAVILSQEILWEDRFDILRALIAGKLPNPEQPQSPEVIVVENFRLRQGRALEQSGSDFPSSQVIGIVGAYTNLLIPPPPIVLQEPVVMGRIEIMERDKKLLVATPHTHDAYKHARYYWVMNLYFRR